MSGNRYALNKIEWLGERLFNTTTSISDGGFMICTEGSCRIIINAKSYDIKKWDLIIVFPYSVIQMLNTTDDFDCQVVGVVAEMLLSINIANKGDIFLGISSHPSITLTQDEAIGMTEYMKILIKEEQRVTQPFYDEIHSSILMILMYKIVAIYSSREPNTELKPNRSVEVFNNFIFELIRSHKSERKLEFYSQKQSITPSHLSRCVKAVTGRKASYIVIDFVINNIKSSLQDSKRPISEISDEFNFCSSSTFSQYFKKYTQTTPLGYRKQLLEVLRIE